MESQVKSPTLAFSSPAWPGRLTGVSIFLCTLFIFLFFQNVPVFAPIVTFCFMLVAVFLASNTSVTADSSARTLTVIKKRIIGSSKIVYPFDDIAFLTQNISIVTNPKGEKSEKITYTIALKSQTSALYPRGYKPNPISMPVSPLTALSSIARGVQEYSRAKELADFIGIPLYMSGGPNDSLANAVASVPGIIEGLKKVPDAMKEAKKENDEMAQEILRNKGN